MPLHLDSTIIANNSCDDAPHPDLWIFWPDTPAVVGANNLVMQTYNVELPPDTLHLDPMLEPLAANRGATETHALALSSPVVDKRQQCRRPVVGPARDRLSAGEGSRALRDARFDIDAGRRSKSPPRIEARQWKSCG